MYAATVPQKTTEQPTKQASILARTAGSLIIGSAVTFALFVVMNALIQNDLDDIVVLPTLPDINVQYQADDEKTHTKTLVKPKPEPIQPPLIARVQSNESNDPSPSMGIDPIDIPIIVETFGAQFELAETSATPVVRVPPKYPIVAARDGIEGWVELSFSIDTSGSVIDVAVIDSQPRRTFDTAAKRALKRWKYKAKIEGGKAVVQSGLSVMLDFKISE